ncbi:MAG TPA: hypothetical protein VLJ59_03580 [Mycobacteriales bacterium]|nr:hypothetical protein [Mycobacteriales bacterium]
MAPARPGLSVVCSVLAIVSAVPLALAGLTQQLSGLLPLLPSILPAGADLRPSIRLLVVATAVLALAAPVAGWLSRLLPPWVVLLAGLVTVSAAYGLSGRSSGSLEPILALQGIGAGCLLAATAALVGAASAHVRPVLAAGWAAAVVGTLILLPRHSVLVPGPSGTSRRAQLGQSAWLLGVAALFGLALAAASLADRRSRLHPRRIDLTALLPLAVGIPVAALAWWPPAAPGRAVALAVAVLLLALGVLAVVAIRLSTGTGSAAAPWSADGRGAVGTATAAVAFVAGVVLLPTAYGLLTVRQLRGDGVTPITVLLVLAALVGVVAGVLGALLPEGRRREVIVFGLLAAAVGTLGLLPVAAAPAAALPGLVLLTGGVGVALGAVLRAVGPLATVVAGGVLGVTVPLGNLLHGEIFTWQRASSGWFAYTTDPLEAARHFAVPGVSAQRWWLLLATFVLVAGAAVATLALAATTARAETDSVGSGAGR